MIEQWAAGCAVAVYGGDRFLGSGFLVAAGEAVTCAHVAALDAGPLTLEINGDRYTELSRTQIPTDPGDGKKYAFPDLAVIRFDPGAGHGCVWLADVDPLRRTSVLCHGFSRHTPEDGAASDSLLLEIVPGSTPYIKVQDGEIPKGMSGSLALDLSTYRVCGMVAASRDPQAPRGGWLVPVSAILQNVPGLAERNAAAHPPGTQWRDAATRRHEFAERLFGSPQPLHLPRQAPTGASPSWWLDPHNRAIGYRERREPSRLLDWATGRDVPVARLLIGPGGAGKTRLAVELAARLHGLGWIAGVVGEQDTDRLPELTSDLAAAVKGGHDVFIAVDYVEGAGRQLRSFLGRLPVEAAGRVRVLLLARFAGAWWNESIPSGPVQHLIDPEPLRLGPLAAGPEEAEAHLLAAISDLRSALHTGTETAPVPAGLLAAARRHTDALSLHALALVSVLHEIEHGELPELPRTWTDPLRLLVAHERRHLRTAGRALLAEAMPETVGRTLLVPTLIPAYVEDEAVAAVERTHPPSGQGHALARLLRDLYPPRDASRLRWWSPLPLDRLGETLLAQVLDEAADPATASAYVGAQLEGVGAREAVQALTVLARLNGSPLGDRRSGAALDAVAAMDGGRLLLPVLLAERYVEGAARDGRARLAGVAAAELVRLVAGLRFSVHGRRLCEVGLEVLDHAERSIRTEASRDDWVLHAVESARNTLNDRDIRVEATSVQDAGLWTVRARLLAELGRNAEAVRAIEPAVTFLRLMVDAASDLPTEPGAPVLRLNARAGRVIYLHDGQNFQDLLASVLGSYAAILKRLGRLAEGDEVEGERLRLLGLSGPEADIDDSPSGIAERTVPTEWPESGESDALTELRRAGPSDRERLAELVNTVLDLGGDKREAGDAEGAREHVEEAVRHARRLALDDSDTYGRLLSKALLISAVTRGEADSLAEGREGVRILAEEHRRNPTETSRIDLAVAHMTLTGALQAAGHHEQAHEHAGAAVDLLQGLDDANPWEVLPRVSTALGVYAETAMTLDRLDIALAAAREGVAVTARRADDIAPSSASQLRSHRRMIVSVQARLMFRHLHDQSVAEASAAATELIAVFDLLSPDGVDDIPVGVLGGAVTAFGVHLRDQGEHEGALATLADATRILAHGPSDRVTVMTAHARAELLWALGRGTESAEITLELLEACRRCTDDSPGALSAIAWAARLVSELPDSHRSEAVKVCTGLLRSVRGAAWMPSGSSKLLGPVIGRLSADLSTGTIIGHVLDAAVHEIAATAPELVGDETAHDPQLAEAFGQTAARLFSSDRARALSLATAAAEMYDATGQEAKGSIDFGKALGLRGMLLLANADEAAGITELTRCLNVLEPHVLAGSETAAKHYHQFAPLLAQALHEAGRDAEREVLARHLDDSGLATAVNEALRPRRKEVATSAAFTAELRSATELSDTDPSAAVPKLRTLIDKAVTAEDWLTARIAGHHLIYAYQDTGRVEDAHRTATAQMQYSRRAGLGPWTRLYDLAISLQLSNSLQRDYQHTLDAVLRDPEGTGPETEEQGLELVKPFQAKEHWWHAGTIAALRLDKMESALPLAEAEVRSRRDRDAPAPDLADTELNLATILTSIGRSEQAAEILARCHEVYRRAGNARGLGVVVAGQARLAYERDDFATASRLHHQALTHLYAGGNVTAIADGHAAFAQSLQRLDMLHVGVGAHLLAGAVILRLIRGDEPDAEQLAETYRGRAFEIPESIGELAPQLSPDPHLGFDALVRRLAGGDGHHADRLLAAIAAAIRARAPLATDFARYRVRWDPIMTAIAAVQGGPAQDIELVRSYLHSEPVHRDWDGLRGALELVLDGHRELAEGLSLDDTDRILLRRCTDLILGMRPLAIELAALVPIAPALENLLGAAQKNSIDSQITRQIAVFEDSDEWTTLAAPLRAIMSGVRDPRIAEGLEGGPRTAVLMLLSALR